jgi:hypothetical protein
MWMKAKKLVCVLFVMCFALDLFAQVDSTFVRYYNPTYETHPFWNSFPTSGIYAANVFEMYDGNFGVQLLSTFHTPPPEMVFPQSPIACYNRVGQYINTTFGPYNDNGLLFGYYSHIIKDGYGGYLALDMFEHRIHRLSSELQYVEWVSLVDDNGTTMSILDLIIEDNGFIVVSNYPDYRIAKFNFELNCLWDYYEYQNYPFWSIIRGSNGGYLIWCGGYSGSNFDYINVLKLTSAGDSLWTKPNLTPGVHKIIELNDRYYGLIYGSVDINTAELRVYDFGVDFEYENAGAPILVIPTYPLLGNNLYGLGEPFSVIKTSDDCIILAVSTPTGEIFKFDNNFDLLWSSNALQNERVGIGFHPLVELGNGDLLYCATVGYQPRQLALVRINSTGNYVGIEDETEQTPAPSVISAFPNPFKTELIIEIKTLSNANNQIEIFNIKGQLVESKTFRGTKATWIPQNLPSGVYILKLNSNSKQIEGKIITYIR